jgi:hypothetical protein
MVFLKVSIIFYIINHIISINNNYLINRFVVIVIALLNIICAKKSSIPIIFAICEGPYSNILSIVKPLICNN